MNANDLRALLARWADEMAQKRDWLIELDSVVGDSDLGLTMSDGFRAASDAANACVLTDVGKLCYQAGKAMASARALHHGHADGQRPDERGPRS